MTESQEASLSGYMDRKRVQFEHHRPSLLIVPAEPKVEKHEKTFPFPPEVWDNEQYGTIADLIEYVRDVNRVPAIAQVEVQHDELSRKFSVRFTWWDVRYLDDGSYRR